MSNIYYYLRHLFLVMLLATAFAIPTCASSGITHNEAPRVIPALQQWTAGKGHLTLQKHARIVVENINDTTLLLPLARTFAADVKAMTGHDFSTFRGKARKGDIVLSLKNAHSQLGDEGYTMTVDSNIRLEAPTTKGVFWATRTVLQILTTAEGVFPCGKAVDFPDYPNRGFMLDCGRKFFSIDFLRQYVKMLSFYKINEFQIHLNDNGFPAYFNNDWNSTYSAFRLESERFPGLTAKDGSYSKAEFVELQKLALKYGVNIIPEIDFPAHSLAFVHYKPNLGSEKYDCDHLDLYKPEVYEFLDSLLEEYIGGDNPTFIGPDVHIGTDEYDGREAERFRWFTDRYLKFINAHGKNPRMWGSLRWLKGDTPVTSKNVTINAWSYDWIDPNASLEAGYKLINTCDTYLYIVPSAGYYRDFLDRKWLYNTWRVGKINRKEELPEHTPGLLGAMFAVWNDCVGNGITQQDVHYRVFPAAQVMAERMWRGRNEEVDYDAFNALSKRIPEGPGVDLLARIKQDTTILAPTDTVVLDGRNIHSTGIKEVGYPYSVEFSICPDSVQAIGGILFHGPHSEVVANWDNTNKIAFKREGQTFVFHNAIIPAGKWSGIRIEGDYKGTTIYVDGEKKERLEGRQQKHYNAKHNRLDNLNIQETLIFPLMDMGNTQNGFKGKIANVTVTQGN